MKKFVAMLLALVMTLSLAACGQKNDTNDTKDDANSDTRELTYAVEAGSAGEAAAAEKGFKTVSVDTQAKALMEVDAGTADAAIIDLLMAGAMVGENTSYPNLKVTDQKLTSELYGVGCRKGSDLASFINSVLAETYASGKMQEIAATYGVQESLVEQSPSEYTASESDSDVKYIQDKGKLIVGITEFEPMDYQDANGQWIGFDADMAKLVREAGRGGRVPGHQLGHQDRGAGRQDHRLRVERHDLDRRRDERHDLQQRLLQQRTGGHYQVSCQTVRFVI